MGEIPLKKKPRVPIVCNVGVLKQSWYLIGSLASQGPQQGFCGTFQVLSRNNVTKDKKKKSYGLETLS